MHGLRRTVPLPRFSRQENQNTYSTRQSAKAEGPFFWSLRLHQEPRQLQLKQLIYPQEGAAIQPPTVWMRQEIEPDF